MASKKSEDDSKDRDKDLDRVPDPRGAYTAIEERRKRREEATTVSGDEPEPILEPIEAAKKRGAVGAG